MSDSVSFKYTLTEDEYVRAMWAYLYYERGWRTLFIFLGCAGALVAAMAVVNSIILERPIFGVLPFFGGLVLVMVTVTWRVGRYQRKAARRSPFVGIEYEVTFSPGGVISRSSLGSSETSWSIYTGARESAEFILLCSGTNLYYPFPKEAFDKPEELKCFRDLIRAHVPDFRGP